MVRTWTIKYAKYCTCRECEKRPRVIAFEYTQYTGGGYEWADSLTDQFCLKCELKNQIKSNISRIRSYIGKHASSAKHTVCLIYSNYKKGVKKPLSVYWRFYLALSAI